MSREDSKITYHESTDAIEGRCDTSASTTMDRGDSLRCVTI